MFLDLKWIYDELEQKIAPITYISRSKNTPSHVFVQFTEKAYFKNVEEFSVRPLYTTGSFADKLIRFIGRDFEEIGTFERKHLQGGARVDRLGAITARLEKLERSRQRQHNKIKSLKARIKQLESTAIVKADFNSQMED